MSQTKESRVLITCTCGAVVKRPAKLVRTGRKLHCSVKCRRASVVRDDGTRRCKHCENWKEPGEYDKFVDSRYSEGFRVCPYCRDCRKLRRSIYHSENKERAAVAHSKWRNKRISEGGDVALKWYFHRLLSNARRRASIGGLPCSITPTELLRIFHNQEGLCYYTGIVLDWHGVGKGRPTRNSMSFDRKDQMAGYTYENVALCTYQVNSSKQDRDEEEFYEFCETVLNKRKLRADTAIVK